MIKTKDKTGLRLEGKKGMVLVFALFVIIALAGIIGARVMRAINANRVNQRAAEGIEAFYEAESGMAYGWAELSAAGFNWYTHIDKDTPITFAQTVVKGSTAIDFNVPATAMPGAAINPLGEYEVAGRNFLVKVFPEELNGEFSGIVIIHSRAAANGVSRVLEQRIGQLSAYEYFFFYPTDHAFASATWDGRNFGGIHVNGDILFKSDPKFYFLTRLTSGSDIPEKGYIARAFNGKYANLAVSGDGETAYGSTVTNQQTIPSNLREYSQGRWATGSTTFKTGAIASPATKTLPYYLEGSGAEYDYVKYDGASLTPLHYTISNTDLKNTAVYEISGHSTAVKLLDNSKDIDVSGVGTGKEDAIFKTLYNDPGATPAQWSEYWTKWKANHGADYQAFHDTGTLTGGEDWERRFIAASYDWTTDTSDTGPAPDGVPDGINREWWENLKYGEDRASKDYEAPAAIESKPSGKPQEKYFLNTKEQASSWTEWLETNSLDAEGEEKTIIQDASQGGKYVDPGTVIGKNLDQNMLKLKAIKGGIYIGSDVTEEWEIWYAAYQQILIEFQACRAACGRDRLCMNTCLTDARAKIAVLGPAPAQYALINPIADCTEEKQFYNAQHPARIEGMWTTDAKDRQYTPSNILKIDLNRLKAKIDDGEFPDFNGIIYVDVTNYPWDIPSKDKNANGVMLVNGEMLPEGGLSIATPNNVLIKGNYNLDPEGCAEKNRPADDPAVLNRVIVDYEKGDKLGYELGDFKWQPAEIISSRAVYTLSEKFPEPSYMPMCNDHDQQYDDETQRYVRDEDYVNGDRNYPTDGWTPAADKTISPNVKTWFDYYNGGTVPVPVKWTKAWVDAKWPSGQIFPLDTNGDSQPDTYILSDDLRGDAKKQIGSKYDALYSYVAVHDPDGKKNPDSPSEINSVSENHIYNTAVVTPYDTSCYVLENWGTTSRVINGAFIQLPASKALLTPLPRGVLPDNTAAANARYSRAANPAMTFNYEARFGKGADENTRPPGNLTFAAEGSWREIGQASF